jgi:uncharacterized LabA/DUF88 family protein
VNVNVFTILVDFDNATNWNSRFNERPPVREDVINIINELINQLVGVVNDIADDIHEIRVRLYGGWHSRINGFTDLYLWIEDALDRLPVRKNGKRLRVESVRCLYGFSGIFFEDTFTAKNGFYNIKKIHPYLCSNSPCKFWAAIKKGGKACPDIGCTLSAIELFTIVYQKTVDTSISVDAINIAVENPEDWIAIFSSDYDIVPAIIGVTRYTSKVMRITREDKTPSNTGTDILRQLDIRDIQIIS